MPSYMKMNLVHALAGLACLCLSSSQAVAASIIRHDVDGQTIIKVSGPLQNEDAARFKAAVADLQSATVLLRSDGGTIFAGLEIGREIRRRGFATKVSVSEGRCLSACAFAWVAGTPRILERKARVGFHAAFSYENGRPITTGSGNALIGAYLRDMGIADTAIIYMTEARPNAFRMLSELDAQAIELPVSYVGAGEQLSSASEITEFMPKGAIPIPDRAPRNVPDESASADVQTMFCRSWQMAEGYQLRGPSIATVTMAKTESECRTACEKTAQCVGYTFTIAAQDCALKSEIDMAVRSRDALSAFTVGTPVAFQR